MRANRLAVLTALAITALARAGSAEGEKNPIAGLAAFGKILDEGAAKFMKGEAPTEAWKPFDVPAKEPAEIEKLRAELKAAGATSLRNVGFEFELILKKKGTPFYYVRSYVHASADGASVMKLDGRSADAKLSVSGAPLDTYTGEWKPFAEAAEAFKKALEAGEPLTYTDAATVEKLLSGAEKALESFKRDLEKAKEMAKKVGRAAKGADEIELRLDDQAFVGLGEDGKAKTILRGGFRMKDGKLQFGLAGLRPLR